MSDILADQPSIHALPDSAEESESPVGVEPKAESEGGETPVPAVAKKVDKAEAKPAADDDDETDEVEPQDLAGFKKALAAARGDKRKARKKWQEAERKLAEHEGRFRALEQVQRQQQAAQPQAQAEQSDPDDEFYKLGPGKFYEERRRAESQVEWRRRVEEESARMELIRDDFPGARHAFIQAAGANPSLLAAFNSQPTPFHQVLYAYKYGKELLELQSIGASSITEVREKVRAEERAKLEAELSVRASGEAEDDESAPSLPAKTIPRSIASARGSGAGVTKAWSGPRPMADILR